MIKKPLHPHKASNSNSRTIQSANSPLIKKKSKTISSSKGKSHSKKSAEKEPRDYIIVNDDIFCANSPTERGHYQSFVEKVKREKQFERKSFLVKSQVTDKSLFQKPSKKSIKTDLSHCTPEQLVDMLTFDQKKQMLFKLQSQIRSHQKDGDMMNGEVPSNINSSNSLAETGTNKKICSEKFDFIEQKLETFKMQLMFKWEAEIEKMESLFEKEKISSLQKANKVFMMEKIKDHKIKILQCTKTLFEKILKEDQGETSRSTNKNANSKIQAIYQSLNNISSMEQLKEENQSSNKNEVMSDEEERIGNLKLIHKNEAQQSSNEGSPLQIMERNSEENFIKEYREETQTDPDNQQRTLFPLTNVQQTQKESSISHFESQEPEEGSQLNEENEPSNKISLKLDLRVDEVVFGQDQYPQNEYDQKESQSNGPNQTDKEYGQQVYEKLTKEAEAKVEDRKSLSPEKTTPVQESRNCSSIEQFLQQPVSSQEKQTGATSNVESDPKFDSGTRTQIKESDEGSAGTEKPNAKEKVGMNIPLILTQDRMESLEVERNRHFRQSLENHIGFQLGCLQEEPQASDRQTQKESQHSHFTTLVDINDYIVGLYEFLMGKYLNTLVDNMNMPYGKSVLDKMYSLQTVGYVEEEKYNPMNNILTEQHFMQYRRELIFTSKASPKQKGDFKVFHDRAVFQEFSRCLNEYRPYFELEGDIYPWVVSEKGITFYEISEDNIEEVFQKSKIKVLQECAILCGVHPPQMPSNHEQRKFLEQKVEETTNKMITNDMAQVFHDWSIRFTNSECLIRLMLAEQIYASQIRTAIQQILQINKQESNAA